METPSSISGQRTFDQTSTAHAPNLAERPRHLPQEHTLEQRFAKSEVAQAAVLLGGGLLLAKGLKTRKLHGLPMALAGFAISWTGACRYFDRDSAHQATGVRAQRGFQFKTAITLQSSPEKIYRRWRDLEGLPKLLNHLDSVRQLDDRRSHWVAKGPLGPVAWVAEVINEREDELLAWRSLPGSPLATAGSLHLQRMPGDRGTILRLSLKYDPPGGQIAATVASMLGQGFEQSVRDDLRHFKQLMETGEIARTDGQPQGTCANARKGERS